MNISLEQWTGRQHTIQKHSSLFFFVFFKFCSDSISCMQQILNHLNLGICVLCTVYRADIIPTVTGKRFVFQNRIVTKHKNHKKPRQNAVPALPPSPYDNHRLQQRIVVNLTPGQLADKHYSVVTQCFTHRYYYCHILKVYSLGMEKLCYK